ncbi:hypothetical protein GCM10010911_53210 [Paenibacillus nasutitermitis]|uniref:Uncharacterized protein n=1 Tax=Paenibacillus nasutitermitis TaxID=1652958 RepID=A0A916ZCL1_9BACL|nr:hypothetical protein GCM10010911_53210 [Paenibacillus nasutitermitis]
MSHLIEWITRHWLSTILILGAAAALTFVFIHRKSLFYKE